MNYQCISADCHIDTGWLPYDLFVSNATPSMKERMPYVVQTDDGPQWVTKGGINLGYANGKGSQGVVGGGRNRYVAGESNRLDRIAATGLYSDGGKGIFRPTTPELRLQDQDRDGLQAEVLYGLLGTGNKLSDAEAAIEFYRIYNDWLSAFCKHAPERFVGLASIPCHTVEVAVNEAQRVSKLNLGGLDVSFSYNMTPLWHAYWDPLWRAASESGLAVHFHTIGPPPPPATPKNLTPIDKMAEQATKTTGNQLFMATILASVIHGGALERFPDLRIVLGESGIGWIPYVLDRMDHEFGERFKNLPLKMKPSEYWRRQCRATFQYDPIGIELLERIGVETIMWGSDYPHPDGVFPDSQEYIQRQFGALPAADRRRITCENAGRFYGLLS